MSQPIAFDDNYQRHLNIAQQAQKNGDLNQERIHLEAAYQLEQSVSLNLQLVEFYHGQNLDDEANLLINEHLSFYLNDQKAWLVYWEVLLKKNEFITARQRLYLVAKNIELSQQQINSFLNSLNALEQASSRRDATKWTALVQKMSGLGPLNPAVQTQLIKEAHFLPLAFFEESLRYLLTNPYLHPLMRATLLDEFAKLHLTTGALTFLDLEQKQREIKVIECQPLADFQLLKKIQIILNELVVEEANPLFELIIEEIRIHLGYLYLNQEVNKEASKWVAAYLVHYQVNVKEQMDSLVLEYLVEQERLRELTANFYNSLE